jgi:hypothetical protein
MMLLRTDSQQRTLFSDGLVAMHTHHSQQTHGKGYMGGYVVNHVDNPTNPSRTGSFYSCRNVAWGDGPVLDRKESRSVLWRETGLSVQLQGANHGDGD